MKTYFETSIVKVFCLFGRSGFLPILARHHPSILLVRTFEPSYCTFELNRCTRNRAAYISTFYCANLMFLDCVESFSIRSTARNCRIMDSIVATWDISRPGKRLGRIRRIGSNWEINKIKTPFIISLNLVSKLEYLSLLRVNRIFKFQTWSSVWGLNHGRKHVQIDDIAPKQDDAVSRQIFNPTRRSKPHESPYSRAYLMVVLF